MRLTVSSSILNGLKRTTKETSEHGRNLICHGSNPKYKDLGSEATEETSYGSCSYLICNGSNPKFKDIGS
jgi:hypothetical protein